MPKGDGGPFWEEPRLVFPAPWAPHTSRGLGLIQDSGQHSRTFRKGYPSSEDTSYLHGCLRKFGLYAPSFKAHCHIQGYWELPYSWKSQLCHYFVGGSLPPPPSFLALISSLQRRISTICAANLLGLLHGPNEMACIKILSEKRKGLQLLCFLLVHLVPSRLMFAFSWKKKKSLLFID